jgi:hypothetical protein
VFGRISLNSLDKERSRTGFLTEFRAAFANISGLAAKKQRGTRLSPPAQLGFLWWERLGKSTDWVGGLISRSCFMDVNTLAIIT